MNRRTVGFLMKAYSEDGLVERHADNRQIRVGDIL